MSLSRASRSRTASVRGILTLAALLTFTPRRAEFGESLAAIRGAASVRGILMLVALPPAGQQSRQMLRSEQ